MFGCMPPFKYDPVTQRCTVSWTTEYQKAIEEGRAVLATHGSHTDRSLQSFLPTIHALASLICPAVTSVEPTDKAAGTLYRVLGQRPDGTDVIKTFGEDLIDLMEDAEGLPLIQLGLQKGWTVHDVLSVMYELDEQARIGVSVVTNAATFAQLSPADQATLWGLISTGTLPEPLLTIPVSALTMQTWYDTWAVWTSLLITSGYPAVTYTTSRTGMGPSGPLQTTSQVGFAPTSHTILTDAAEGIVRPTDIAGSLFKFLDFDWPEQKELRDLRFLAFIEANATTINPATGNPFHQDSDAAFQQLLSLKASRGVRSFSG